MEVSSQEKVIATLKEKYGDEILHVETPYNFLTVTLKREKIVEIIRFFYDHADLRFQYLTTLGGIHYPELKQIAVFYQLHNLHNNHRIRLKIYLPEENPVTETLTPVFTAANWLERETYDFYGVIFEGHPNLKRILNVEEMIIFPMRKEYPLEDQTREDKNDSMFGR
ncbi:MAG TPA: NADH-quinone oxidoreductase subunit C [Chryseolinea sp.]|nr:NADH-quinone oxidoreductase subunit C [Chryseolinea sp.]